MLKDERGNLLKKETLILLTFFLTLHYLLFTIPGFSQIRGERTTTIITLKEDGSAEWFIETRFYLENNETVQAFNKYLQVFNESKSLILNQEKERFKEIVKKAELVSKRPMHIEEFDVSMGRVGKVGMLIIKFVWSNFQKRVDDKLVMGDVFNGGYYLSTNEELEVVIPEEWNMYSVIPPPDFAEEGKVIWKGPRDFGGGEPHVEIKKKLFNINLLLIPLGLLLIGAAAFITVKKQKSKVITVLKEDERKTIEELIRVNGEVTQQELRERLGFSKAKMSMILKNLERRKLIERYSSGRTKKVRLIG